MDPVSIGRNASYTVSGLKSNTFYRCQVYGQNFVGNGEAASVENFTNRKMLSVVVIIVVVLNNFVLF